MEPEIIMGDHVLVCKPVYGARLFNLFDALKGKQVKIYRAPGFSKIRRNDVVIFNFPYPNQRDKMEMHIMKYYMKRCIGLSGDTLEIRNGFYHIRGYCDILGNIKSQLKVSIQGRDCFEDGVFNTFPFDSIEQWNIKEFGPLYIPKTGDVTAMNRTNYLIYKNPIEWEQNATLVWKDSSVWLRDSLITSYQFQKNYYFMSGDRVENSQDSRYWGLLPEEYIVGKAWIIWKSKDLNTGKIRWNRLFKKIY
jgi:signal peptidase I